MTRAITSCARTGKRALLETKTSTISRVLEISTHPLKNPTTVPFRMASECCQKLAYMPHSASNKSMSNPRTAIVCSDFIPLKFTLSFLYPRSEDCEWSPCFGCPVACHWTVSRLSSGTKFHRGKGGIGAEPPCARCFSKNTDILGYRIFRHFSLAFLPSHSIARLPERACMCAVASLPLSSDFLCYSRT